MAKRKNSPALFEVISRSRERQSQSGLRVPTWMGGDRQQPDETPESQAQEPAAQKQSPQADEHARPASQVQSQQPAYEPVFSTSGGRLRLSLNYSGAIVLGVAVVLLIAAAFAIGRATGGSGDAGDSAAKAGVGGGEQERTETSGVQRVAGKHYLIIWDADAGVGMRPEAERIAEFFNAHGESAEVRELKDQGGQPFLAVWSTEGFDRPDSQAAENYKTRIRRLGEQYRQEHDNVRFNPWYAVYQPSQR
ncbi:MAG: hypothetical protein ACP5HU_02210 [Phycisphaerae bacterium]